MKYNFYALKKGNKPLPEDVNKPVEEAIDKIFGCAGLLQRIKDRRIHRNTKGFGKIEYADTAKQTSCLLQFVNGIIPKYELTAAIKMENGNTLLDTYSVNNDALIYDNNQLKTE